MTKEFKTLSDIDSGKRLLSPDVVDSDHPVYLIVEVEYTDEWGDDCPYAIHGQVVAVSPGFAKSHTELDSYLSTIGMDRAKFDELDIEAQADVLAETGCKATLFQTTGETDEDEDKVIEACKAEITPINVMFGFYMDKPQNRIGATGWDWIKGSVYPMPDED